MKKKGAAPKGRPSTVLLGVGLDVPDHPAHRLHELRVRVVHVPPDEPEVRLLGLGLAHLGDPVHPEPDAVAPALLREVHPGALEPGDLELHPRRPDGDLEAGRLREVPDLGPVVLDGLLVVLGELLPARLLGLRRLDLGLQRLEFRHHRLELLVRHVSHLWTPLVMVHDTGMYTHHFVSFLVTPFPHSL